MKITEKLISDYVLIMIHEKGHSFRNIVFLGEGGPTPGHNTQHFLPSGIAVIGIDSWVERFTKLFQNVVQEASSTNPVIVKTWSQLTFKGQA